MSVSCPYRHISYATWRLHVFRALFQPVDALHVSDLPFRSSVTGRTTGKRQYSTSEGISKEKTNKDEASHRSRSANTPLKSPVLGTQRRGKRAFNPYSEKGRKELQGLVKKLQHMTIQALADPKDQDPIPFASWRSVLPESPVTRKIRQERRTKRMATREEKLAYQNNPWAQMLASSVRYCQASSVRMPADLMTKWGFMRHPGNGKVYVMPNELADMDNWGDKRGVQNSEKTQRAESRDPVGTEESKQAQESLPEKSSADLSVDLDRTNPLPGEDDPARHVLERPTSTTAEPPSLRLLPYINLLRLLTLTFTRQDAKSPGGRVTLKETVSRIIPLRWRASFDAARHYEQVRKHVEAETGHHDDRTPGPDADIQLSHLQWQGDIASRVLHIMRTRVWSCLETLVHQSTSGRARHQRRVLAIPVPDTGKLVLQNGRLSTASADAASEKKNDPEPPPDWLAGSIFLHVGDTSPSMWIRADSETQARLEPLPSHDLIPPMISVNDTFRLPIFSLAPLFGPDKYREHLQLFQQSEVFQFPAAEAVGQTPPPYPQDYVVLIKPTTEAARRVIQEIWQLWRYVGGRNAAATTMDDAGDANNDI